MSTAGGRRETFSPRAAVAVVIANMIGTGVFTSLGFQLEVIDSGFAILALWVVGGLVALCGALCYAELGARLPRSGGEYNFLTEIYHPMAGFISGWVSATVGFAAPTALAALTFGSYLASVLPVLSPTWLATGLVVIVSAVHATSHRNSARLQGLFTVAKVVVIVGFSIAALLAVDAFQPVRFAPAAADLEVLGSGGFAISLIYVGYAYSGWNAATYLTGELSDPGRTLPWVLVVGTLVVTACYVLLNGVFLAVAPMAEMEGVLEVGYVAAVNAFGERGGAIMAGILALLLISTVSAMVMAAPRVLQVMGEDFRVFRFLASKNHHGVPAMAVCTQSAVSLLLLWTASFDSILVFSGATMALNTMFAVAGLFLLRRRAAREVGVVPVFSVPLFPLPAIIFLAVTAVTLVYLAALRPTELLFSVGVIIAGSLGYLVSRRLQSIDP